MRIAATTLALVAWTAPLAAQQHQHPQTPAATQQAAATKPNLPAGWQMRLDRANADPSGISFVTMDPGWHVTTGPSAIFWDPSRTATGQYRAEATLHLFKTGEHNEGYGLILGGRNLDAADQDYLYFLVRQDGKFLVKHRAGAEVHTIVDWTDHAAVRRPGADGKPVANALAVDVGAKTVDFYVNGEKVQSLDRPSYLNTDGVVGLRVNHRLNVHVEGLRVATKG